MVVRSLTPQEQNVAECLRKLGLATHWEWMAAFDDKNGKMLTLCTSQLAHKTLPDNFMQGHWAAGEVMTIHHNHLSGESLSYDDWAVLLDPDCPVAEIFAHTIDGTIYYGEVIDRAGLRAALAKYAFAELDAQTSLNNNIGANPHWRASYGTTATGDAGLRKHVVSLALAQKGVVKYEYDAGPTVGALMTELAEPIIQAQAAAYAAL